MSWIRPIRELQVSPCAFPFGDNRASCVSNRAAKCALSLVNPPRCRVIRNGQPEGLTVAPYIAVGAIAYRSRRSLSEHTSSIVNSKGLLNCGTFVGSVGVPLTCRPIASKTHLGPNRTSSFRPTSALDPPSLVWLVAGPCRHATAIIAQTAACHIRKEAIRLPRSMRTKDLARFDSRSSNHLVSAI